MSLIDDALKRAQEEAARQEEAHRLSRRPWIAPQPAKPANRAGAVAAIAFAFALAAAGSAWFLARRGSPAPTRMPPPSRFAPAAVAPPTPSPAPLESVEVPPPPANRPDGEATKANRPGPAARAASADSPPPEAVPAPTPQRPPRAAPPIPDGKTFVRTVNLPGQDPIELDGIVFSESNPVAVIGGRLLGPGASIGEFEIVRIEENRVTLRGRGVTIFLTPS